MCIKLEDYLINKSSFKSRQIIAKFRVSDHILEIETGRYKNIPRENRLCKICNEIDDERHFFLSCKQNLALRKQLFLKIDNKNPMFSMDLSPKLKLLSLTSDFIKQSLELRT